MSIPQLVRKCHCSNCLLVILSKWLIICKAGNLMWDLCWRHVERRSSNVWRAPSHLHLWIWSGILKPTAFELFLELRSKGWEWKNLGWKTCRFEETPHPTWSVAGEQSVLRWRVPLLLVFGGASLNRKGCEEHQFLDAWTVGDLLTRTAFTLAQQARLDELQKLLPNQPAQFYRTWNRWD